MTNPENYPDRGRARVATPKAAPPAYRYTRQFLSETAAGTRQATWGPRFVALFIDFWVVSLPYNLLGGLFWIRRQIDNGNLDFSNEYTLGIPREVHNLLWIVVFGLYCTVTTLWLGATPGKKLMNLKLIREEGRAVGPPALFLRYSVGYVLSAVILGAGFFLAFRDSRGQTLHDKIFKTYVVIADIRRV